MSEEKKVIELNDEDIEKVSGGVSFSDICPNCQYFCAKDPNGNQNKTNCQNWFEEANICRGWYDAGGKTYNN